MKRAGMLWLGAVVAVGFAMTQMGCGGGGGGGSVPPVKTRSPIALYADSNYVKYSPGDPIAEASNVEAALRVMGHTVKPFTGVSAAAFTQALAGGGILVIPELEGGDLSQDLEPGAESAIADFVTGGGTLLVFNTSPSGFCNDILLVNALFAHDIAPPMGTITGTLSKNELQAAGTLFEGCCPATLDTVATVKVLDSTSLPPGTRSVYADGSGNAALAIVPEGAGKVIIMGWDWQEARPVGAQDGGWWSVLYRAASTDDTRPDVALVSDDVNTPQANPYASDVIGKLRKSGQFDRVETIDAAALTPSLAQLMSYDAVLVYSALGLNGFADTTALGNVLADYVDGGGGLVTAGASVLLIPGEPTWYLGGRFVTGGYSLTPRVSVREDAQWAEGPPHTYGAHPVMAGYNSFYGGTISSRADTTDVMPGATAILRWADGVPLVTTGEMDGVRRIDLGFHPVSSDMFANFWDATTDGDKLLANALTWAANLENYRYQSYPAIVSSPTIPDGGATVSSAVIVSDGPESISRVKVTVDITHPANADLDISLTSPGGATVDLSTDNGGEGHNYAGVTFDDAAGRAAGSFFGMDYSFSGSYIPEESLAAFIGTDSNGTWSLSVSDDGNIGASGTLNSWTLHLR